jgi:hypothetical protein
MTRFLYPLAGKGQAVLGGVVFTDGAAEADLGPHTSEYLEMIGATIVRSEEELDEHTVDELHAMARAGGFRAGSHLHKADLIRVLRGEDEAAPTDHKAEARGSVIVDVDPPEGQKPAGDDEDADPADESTPDTNAGEASEQHGSEGAADEKEDATWSPTPPPTTSPTTTGSLSLQERRRQNSQDGSSEPPAGS